MLTVSTFKKFCMKASTTRADDICNYYMKMENIMFQYTEEKLIEYQEKLINTQNILNKFIKNDNEDEFFWTENSISDFDNKNVLYLGFIGIQRRFQRASIACNLKYIFFTI